MIETMTPAFNSIIARILLLLIVLVGLAGSYSPALAAEVAKTEVKGIKLQVSFQYLLSNFSGPARTQWARLAFEPTREEIYSLDPASNRIAIYSPSGMEVFSFGDQGEVIRARDLAVAEDGSMFLLGRDALTTGIQQLNYRGEPVARIRPAKLPPGFATVSPDRLEYHRGRFYLLDSRQLKLLVMDTDGKIVQHHNLAETLNAIVAARSSEQDKGKSIDTEINGFTIAPDGAVYFTVATLFSAFKLTPDGDLEPFGTAGSGPGKFGVVSGIAVDRDWIYVADRLRSAVLIFNHDYIFQGEFGYRGSAPEDMIVPNDLALNPARGRLYVSQAANKGVGVYRVEVLPPAPSTTIQIQE